MNQDSVQKKLEDAEKYFAGVTSSNDTRNGHVSALLGLAVVNLDRTSTRLAIANFILGFAILITALVQIYLAIYH